MLCLLGERDVIWWNHEIMQTGVIISWGLDFDKSDAGATKVCSPVARPEKNCPVAQGEKKVGLV